ncbi:MAG: hypothetical protein Fur0015_08860 [Ignavibacteriales bacterium]
MIVGFIFSLHLIFIIYVFVLKIKKESVSAGFISSAFIVILFAVGWSLASLFANSVLPDSFYEFSRKIFKPLIDLIANVSGRFLQKPLINPNESWKEINGDSFGLFLLTIAEFFFYKGYYKDLWKTTPVEKGK